MDIRPVGDLRIYIGNKAATMITGITLNITRDSKEVRGTITRQKVTKGGAFGGSLEEVTENVILENWRDSVVRLRLEEPDKTIEDYAKENQDGECEGVEEAIAEDGDNQEDYTEDPEEESDDLL